MTMGLTVRAWPSLSPECRGPVTVYRRRAHLVIWNAAMRCERPWWWLYSSPAHAQTWACVYEQPGRRVLLPLCDLLHHWDWFYGEVCGFEVVDGWGVHGPARAKALEIHRHDDGYWHWALPPGWDPDART